MSFRRANRVAEILASVENLSEMVQAPSELVLSNGKSFVLSDGNEFRLSGN